MKTIAFILCLFAAPASWAACTASDLKGNYAFEVSGWYSEGIPTTLVGVVNFDGIKKAKLIRVFESAFGFQERVYGGGNFKVKSDCAVIWNNTLSNGAKARIDMVIAGDRLFVQVTNVIDAVSGSGTAQRIP
jgi:hypothetical protein